MINGVRRRESSNHSVVCRKVLFFFVFLFPFGCNIRFGLGLNSEGLALLRFRERIVTDPVNALSSWNIGRDNADPCYWFGVQCFDGKVVALNLKDLCLRGTLAPELGKLAHMRSIILRNNSFYGAIPKEIVELKELEVLDLGYNDFTGPIPFELVNNLSIVILLLDNNRFVDGAFPEHYKFMLSGNQVEENQLSASGGATCIDKFFSQKIGQPVDVVQQNRRLLQALHVSKGGKNDIKKASASPPVISPAPSPSHSPNSSSKNKSSHPPPKSPPEPQSGSKNKPSTADSAPILSPSPAPSPSPKSSPSLPPSSPSMSPSPSQKERSPAPSPVKSPVVASPVSSHSSPVPSPASNLSSKAGNSHTALIWSSIAGGSLVFVVSVIAIIICRSSNVVTVKPWATGLSGQLQKAFVSGVPKLKRAELETACEDFSNIIGTLTDGTVYKGTLSSGVEIAVVSSLVKSQQQWSRNLETQFRKKIETLSKVNHKNFVNLIGYCEEEKPFTRMMVFEYAPNGTLFEHLHIKEAERLDWRTRLRIAMGMAYCLEHMHQLHQPVSHRDLQSSSVYLSEDYAAKVSDFSFWTEVTSEKMRSPSMQLLATSMSDKESNVHSFGILLFEIITGRIPYSSHDGSVEDWVWDYIRGNDLPKELVDPTLTMFQEENIQKLFVIIKDCLHPDPRERPTMREVAMRLMEITGMEPDAATPRVSPLWWAELEVLASA